VIRLQRFGASPVDRLLAVTDPWMSCDECFEDLDLVIDAVVRSGANLSEKFRVHLGACTACDEEARGLAALVAQNLRVGAQSAPE
jgi:hypothetical protein